MRKKLRELGLSIGVHPTGHNNNITDVPGVKVGHFTLWEEDEEGRSLRTGVTAILPHEGNLFQEKVLGASYVINGFGKTIGLVQLEELGTIEAPIMLTNTFSVGAVLEGTLQYMLTQNPQIGETTGTINTIVGECNDSYLNHIRGMKIKPNHAIAALNNAKAGIILEGSVGAGTGMTCFGWKGGIGSASRKIDLDSQDFMMGALVLSNFGKKEELLFKGFPVADFFSEEVEVKSLNFQEQPRDGSIIIVIATDLPLSERQLKRISKRATVGLARTGSHIHHGSGDIVIAFTNSHKIAHEGSGLHIIKQVSENKMNLFFDVVAELVEEAIWNSLLTATTVIGDKERIREELPVHKLITHLSPMKK